MSRSCAAVLAALVTLLLFPQTVAGTERVEQPAPPGCSIKGNVSRYGQLYFLPSHPQYDSVKMSSPAKRWFCSEEDAQRAGWTVAKSFRPGLPVHNEDDRRPPKDADVPCERPLKGNVTTDRNGNRIRRYHEFDTPRYAETIVRQSAGDQYFCSVDEANAAGFERAGDFKGYSGHNQRDCDIPSDIPEEARHRGAYIKGNVSSAGRIFHEPGTPHYAETQITLQRGEQWFRSVTEAQAAGWRAPRTSFSKINCGVAQTALQ